MSNKVAGRALRAGTSICHAVSQAAVPQARVFSVSSARQAHAIAFTPTSSPELDATLATITKQILHPSYLTMEQRKRLYSPRYAAALKKDPIAMEIDEEVLKFTHVDMFSLPNTRRIVFQAIENMKDRHDFENLPRLLEGILNAHRKLKQQDYHRMIRHAGDSGFIYTMIECARTSRRTGFKLDTSQKVNELMAYVQAKAIDSKWDKVETEQALVWADLVIDLLEHEPHQRRRRHGVPDDGRFPLHRDPQILAARLHLAAALSVKHHGGQDVDGRVTRHATEVAALWPWGKGLQKLHPEGSYAEKEEMHYLTNPNKLLVMGVPLLHGMDMAMEVVEKGLANELKAIRDPLDGEVQAALAKSPKGRGADLYNTLLGDGVEAEGEAEASDEAV